MSDRDDAGETDSPRRRGRPPRMDSARREELVIDAAVELLHDNRLDQVTMDAVAARAGMSKRTIYGVFDSRDALLGAALARIGRSVFAPLSDVERNLPLFDRLCRLLTARKPQEHYDDSVEMLRAIITAVHDYPRLAEQMSRESRGSLERLVQEELVRAEREGEVVLPDGRVGMASVMLIDMAFENPLGRLLDPSITPETPEDRAWRRRCAVSVFLRGIAP